MLGEQTTIGGKTVEMLNTILKYSQVNRRRRRRRRLFTHFLLALGNRSQGYNRGYALAFVGYCMPTSSSMWHYVTP